MSLVTILLVIALVLAIVSLFVPRQFTLLAAAVIVTIVALLLGALGVTA